MILKKDIGRSIEFSNRNGYFILKTSIEDLPSISNRYGLSESPSTYIVLGDSIDVNGKNIHFYVGESSVNVVSRLKESISKRPWIKEIFIIVSPQGRLTMEIVKSLEFMIFQTLNNCLIRDNENIFIKPDNAVNGVIGYRSMLSENEYTEIIHDIFKFLFSDVIMYSLYRKYFNDFNNQFNIIPDGQICINKETNEIYSSIKIDDRILVAKNSRITIQFDSLGYCKDSTRVLFKGLMSNKAIYPSINNGNIEWKFSRDSLFERSLLSDILILFSNSLNANIKNSLMDYNAFAIRSRR